MIDSQSSTTDSAPAARSDLVAAQRAGRLARVKLEPSEFQQLAAEQSLVLALVADSQRSLTEESGSFGGLTPPGNVALGPDGSIYLLDTENAQLKRFDPCECRFLPVPCFGGTGSWAATVEKSPWHRRLRRQPVCLRHRQSSRERLCPARIRAARFLAAAARRVQKAAIRNWRIRGSRLISLSIDSGGSTLPMARTVASIVSLRRDSGKNASQDLGKRPG